MFFDMSCVYACVFVHFVLITVLAAPNVITCIFGNSKVDMAPLDSDVKVQQEESRTESIILDGFRVHMQQKVRLLLAVVGWDVSDASSFMSLLDVNGSSEGIIDGFVIGCMRFRVNPSDVNLECSHEKTCCPPPPAIQQNTSDDLAKSSLGVALGVLTGMLLHL